MTHDRLLEMVDLYALDALPAEEQTYLERHMEGCSSCESELTAAMTVTAALIPDSEPPNHVWDRIVLELSSPGPGPVTLRPRRSLNWTAIAAIAAALMIAVGGLLVTASDGTESVIAAAEQARAEAGSVVTSLVAGDETVAEVILTSEGQGYVLPTKGLESLDASRTYQLWAITPEELVISAAVLGNAPGPSTFTWRGEISGFALTREVAGGVPVSAGDVVSVVTGL